MPNSFIISRSVVCANLIFSGDSLPQTPLQKEEETISETEVNFPQTQYFRAPTN